MALYFLEQGVEFPAEVAKERLNIGPRLLQFSSQLPYSVGEIFADGIPVVTKSSEIKRFAMSVNQRFSHR